MHSVRTDIKYIFVSIHNSNVASYRFRVEKVAQKLRLMGKDVTIINISHLKFEAAYLPRLAYEIFSGSGKCVVVFQKTRAVNCARLARRLGATVCYDIDDGSLYRIDGSMRMHSIGDDLLDWMKLIDVVVVGSIELGEWFKSFCCNKTYVIPTCVDVENYIFDKSQHGDVLRIGWVGGHNPDVLLMPIQHSLSAVAQNIPYKLIVVAGSPPTLDHNIPCTYIPWTLGIEPAIFNQFDIGIMPLPDNERAKMKAGFKLLQYMAAGLPVVASPIGVNKQIVINDWNGYLANDVNEWIKALSRLLNDGDLRRSLGNHGRTFVRDKYSIEVAAAMWNEYGFGLFH